MNHDAFVFPKWTNWLKHAVAVGGLTPPAYVILLVTFGFTPYATDVGYMPKQPVPYSHAIHAGDLGIDCRYCHVSVESSAHASVPPTQTCMNCHSQLFTDSPRLAPVFDSFGKGDAAKAGMPVEWVRIHDLPDYAYFNHSAHVNRGVGCVECHGRVDRMEVVYQAEPLSMAWCIECHRNPAPRLRPPSEVTNMNWTPSKAWLETEVFEYIKQYKINPSTDCSTCHR